jgi:mannonate dehydratase
VAAWIDSLRAVAEADGPRVICYNFMPVLDWTRTDLRHPAEGGGTAMRFRPDGFRRVRSSPAERTARRRTIPRTCASMATSAAASAGRRTAEALAAQHHRRAARIDGKLDAGRCARLPRRLRGMGPETTCANLIAFLKEVVPVAEELGLRLCCHPDDPPFPLLGPAAGDVDAGRLRDRAGGRAEPRERRDLLHRVAGRAGGFRSGGLRPALGPRIHFAHLRNTTRDADGDGLRVSFEESAHLAGDTDMVATIGALLAEEAARRDAGRLDAEIPMRPDHGHDLLDDLKRRGSRATR